MNSSLEMIPFLELLKKKQRKLKEKKEEKVVIKQKMLLKKLKKEKKELRNLIKHNILGLKLMDNQNHFHSGIVN